VGIAGALTYYKNQVLTGVKAIQDNAGGMSMAFQLQNQALTDQMALLNRLNGALGDATGALALIPHPYARAASLVTGVGTALTGLILKTAELEREGFSILQVEMAKSAESFKVITGAGALFAGGMTEIRQQAGAAGLDLKTLAQIAAVNANAFTQIGGSVGDGVKRFTQINKEMSGFRQGLLNLGYSIEDQAQATVNYMSLLRTSGNLRAGEDAKVAAAAKDYLVNLKAISSITGEDLKQQQARVKSASEQAAVQVALAEGGEKMQDKFTNLVARFPGYEKEIGQLLTIGEITDPLRAVMLANNAELDTALRTGVKNVQDNNVSTEAATRENDRVIKEQGAVILANARENQKIFGTINMATGNMAEYAELANRDARLGLQGQQQNATAAKSALDTTNDLMTTTDALTKASSAAEVAFRNAAAALNNDVTPLLTKFAVDGLGSVQGMVKTIEAGDKKIRDALKTFTGVVNILTPGRVEQFGLEPRTNPVVPNPMLPGGGSDDVPAGTMGQVAPRNPQTQLAANVNNDAYDQILAAFKEQKSPGVGTQLGVPTAALSDMATNLSSQLKDSIVQAITAARQPPPITADLSSQLKDSIVQAITAARQPPPITADLSSQLKDSIVQAITAARQPPTVTADLSSQLKDSIVQAITASKQQPTITADLSSQLKDSMLQAITAARQPPDTVAELGNQFKDGMLQAITAAKQQSDVIADLSNQFKDNLTTVNGKQSDVIADFGSQFKDSLTTLSAKQSDITADLSNQFKDNMVASLARFDQQSDTGNLSNQFRDSFVQAMTAFRQEQSAAQKPAATDSAAVASSVATAVAEALNGPIGVNQTMMAVKLFLEQDSSKQLAALQTQTDKVDDLLAVMKESADYSRRIANDMA
jgi:hypothetical protein